MYNTDLQLGKRKLEGVLSMLKFANSSKRSQVVRSGFQWWSAFALMEVLFLRLSFFEQRTFRDNGFLRASMAIGDLLAILVMFMECSGSLNVLNLRHMKKLQENIVSSSVMDTIAILPANG